MKLWTLVQLLVEESIVSNKTSSKIISQVIY